MEVCLSFFFTSQITVLTVQETLLKPPRFLTLPPLFPSSGALYQTKMDGKPGKYAMYDLPAAAIIWLMYEILALHYQPHDSVKNLYLLYHLPTSEKNHVKVNTARAQHMQLNGLKDFQSVPTNRMLSPPRNSSSNNTSYTLSCSFSPAAATTKCRHRSYTVTSQPNCCRQTK